MSIDAYFFPGEERHVFVYTDSDISHLTASNGLIIHHIKIPHEGWPLVTTKRFDYFLRAKNDLLQMDYCFYMDVDAVMVNTFNPILLPSGMFATVHPIFRGGPGTPERNPRSSAYIPEGVQNTYFYGGFWGGATTNFLTMSSELKNRVEMDLAWGFIATWWDESQMNRYFYENPPVYRFDYPLIAAEGISTKTSDTAIWFIEKQNRGGHDYLRGVSNTKS
jgi:hypothetical protein